MFESDTSPGIFNTWPYFWESLEVNFGLTPPIEWVIANFQLV